MNDYAKYIENIAANKESMVFFNSGPEHAAIVMSNIFKYSENEIRIWTGKFSGEVSGKEIYFSELKGFLEKKGKLKIILEEFDNTTNPVLYKILAYYQYFNPEQVEIRQTTSRIKEEGSEKFVHFTVGGKSMYRLEEDTKNFIARGNFNDPIFSKRLIEVFDGVFASMTPIVLN